MKCPNCGGQRLLGLYSAFWAEVDEDGESIKPFEELSSETEMTLLRQCLFCFYEFECE